jgi:hypothetical protein
MVIVYEQDGRVIVVFPTGELSIEETAAKDVPAGVPYWLVDAASLPSRDYRNAWRLDKTAMGAPSGVGA